MNQYVQIAQNHEPCIKKIDMYKLHKTQYSNTTKSTCANYTKARTCANKFICTNYTYILQQIR